MSKVYMKADENEAGVTVEDDVGFDGRVVVRQTAMAPPVSGGRSYSDAEARATVEGLLRRMLERGEGSDTQRGADLDQWVNAIYQEWRAGR